ncbi:MAG: acyl-CoA dehydratase activase [Planctomycetaceae bacterium]|nr:acyl-CoA dehydratase activase [Planctomycetaceae bacterium]
MITAGIDAGSRAIKIVLYAMERNAVLDSACGDQGIDQQQRTGAMFDRLLEKNKLKRQDLAVTVATGYGRHLLDFCDSTITEITCHAAGVRRHLPDAMTIIDIGGQDSKLIRLGSDGKVRDFAMNDRCAAGTGRFLEVVSERLEVPLEQLGAFAQQSEHPAQISSICVVFAETEIVGLLASGQSPENIVAGVQTSIARRLLAMAGREVESPVVFTGGVAMIPGMKEAIEKMLDKPIATCPQPQLTGALGAAILAAEKKKKQESK